MQRNVATKREPATPGVIDTIAEGFSIALVQPLLMLVPMLLDLYFWAGWRVSISPLTDRLGDWLQGRNSADVDDVADTLRRAGDGDVMQLFALLVPSLLSDIDRTDLFQAADRSVVVPSSWLLALVVLVVAFLGSAFLVMLYTVPLADTALDRHRTVEQLLRAIVTASVALARVRRGARRRRGALARPVAGGSGGAHCRGDRCRSLLASIAVLLGIVAYLMLWFVPDAIVASQVGPLRAIYLSITVVRGYFWQTLGLTTASMVITLGLGEFWRQLVDSAPGLLLAVIANAFVATSLALASIIFYSRRIRLLRPEFAP